MSDVTRSNGLLPLRCSATWPRADVCVVHVAGELDIATAPVLAAYLREQTASHPTELVLDLGAVTLLAATGLALIVAAQHGDDGVHGRLHLTGVTGNRAVERVLLITGLRSVLDVHDTLATLLEAAGPA